MLKLALALISVPSLWALGPCPTADLAERASAAKDRGEFRLGGALYRELARNCPDMPEFRVNAGLMLHLAGDYEGALVEFRQAIKANNKLFAAHLFAGLDSLKLQRHSEARVFLMSAYALNQADPTVNIALGQLHADLGEYAKANGFYGHASRLHHRNADAWYGLAVTYIAIQREAIEVLAEDRDSAKYLDQIARADFENLRAERKDLDQLYSALRAGSNDVQALCRLATLAGGLAQQAIARVMRLDPSSARVHLLLANAHSELHDVAKAQEEFDIALRLDPESFPAHLALATMYAREHQHGLALQELRVVLKVRPQDPEASYLQARMLIEEQRFKESLPYLEYALAGTPANRPHIHALRGKAYAALGRTKEAIAEYEQALPADRRGAYSYQLYRIYLRAGEPEKAQAMLKQVKGRLTQ